MRSYYVYIHKTVDTDEIFYVGKGFGRRAFSKDNRNRFWHNIVNKHGKVVEFIEQNMSESGALSLESNLIMKYKALGLCRANLSSGGTSGASGIKWSQESRENFSKKMTGKKLSEIHKKSIGLSISGDKNGFYGRKHSDEFKKKISVQNKGKYVGSLNPASREVFDLDTGEVFPTIRQAAKSLNISIPTVNRHIRNKVSRPRIQYLKMEI